MRERWKGWKLGEKILFVVVGLLIVVTILNYTILESVRRSSDKPMFPVRTHYEFSGDGFRGSELFRKNNCTLCHRAIGNGSNMSLNLDGIGSRHDLAYIEAFLSDPEATYRSRTLDHGPAPKEAAYVAQLAEVDRHAIAVFLSQLKTDRGGASAEQPPEGKSSFIDAMLDMWVPDNWRLAFHDVRTRDNGGGAAPGTTANPPAEKDKSAEAPGKTVTPQENSNGH